jgi:hypothetical protein
MCLPWQQPGVWGWYECMEVQGADKAVTPNACNRATQDTLHSSSSSSCCCISNKCSQHTLAASALYVDIASRARACAPIDIAKGRGRLLSAADASHAAVVTGLQAACRDVCTKKQASHN